MAAWRVLSSLFGCIAARRDRPGPVRAESAAGGPTVAIVAIAANGGDRQVLREVSASEGIEVHFVESPEKALAALESLRSPVALVDRNWPGSDWRTVVEELSLSPGRPCVILMSGVLDERLWAEVVGCGGYEVLAKPLQAEQAARVIKLALSYQLAASRTLLRARL